MRRPAEDFWKIGGFSTRDAKWLRFSGLATGCDSPPRHEGHQGEAERSGVKDGGTMAWQAPHSTSCRWTRGFCTNRGTVAACRPRPARDGATTECRRCGRTRGSHAGPVRIGSFNHPSPAPPFSAAPRHHVQPPSTDPTWQPASARRCQARPPAACATGRIEGIAQVSPV